MKRERDEYVHAVESLKSLEQMVEEERELNSTYKNEAETNRHRLATAGRENERLKKQVRYFSLFILFFSISYFSF